MFDVELEAWDVNSFAFRARGLFGFFGLGLNVHAKLKDNI